MLTHNMVNRSKSFRIVATDSSGCIYLGFEKWPDGLRGSLTDRQIFSN